MSNNFLDKDGNVVVPIDFNLTLGRKTGAQSRSFALDSDAYTVLQSLATLLTSIGNNTDGLEALATTLNGYVDQLEGYTDTLETKLQSIIDQGAATTDVPVETHKLGDFITI